MFFSLLFLLFFSPYLVTHFPFLIPYHKIRITFTFFLIPNYLITQLPDYLIT